MTEKNNAATTETTALILRDFELVEPEKPLSETELFDYLADAIAYMIEHKFDYLLSLLYRLDVSEANINAALSPANPDLAHIALAKAVLERQKQRVATKRAYRAQNPTDWDWDLD